MPMSFPDMESLRLAAEVWKFRPAAAGEDEAAYRARRAADIAALGRLVPHSIRVRA